MTEENYEEERKKGKLRELKILLYYVLFALIAWIFFEMTGLFYVSFTPLR